MHDSCYLFSIVIPAYKSRFLKECIDSVLAQTYPRFEVIVVNDASPEDIDSVLQGYSDPRIRYYHNENNIGAINVVDNWNVGLACAKGEYIICMGDDDKLLPNCLQTYIEIINSHPGIGLIHGWTEIIDENSTVIELTTHRCEIESAASLAWHRWYSYLSQFIGDFCFESTYLKEHGGFYKLPMAWGSDDISAIICAMKNGVANTQTPVFQYRRSPHTISNTGGIRYKLEAINLEEQWYHIFLSGVFSVSTDSLYVSQMRREIKKRFEKKRGDTLAEGLRRDRKKVVIWLFLCKKYNVSFRYVGYAIFKSFFS